MSLFSKNPGINQDISLNVHNSQLIFFEYLGYCQFFLFFFLAVFPVNDRKTDLSGWCPAFSDVSGDCGEK